MIDPALVERATSKCELCSSTDELSVYEVLPLREGLDHQLLVCEGCFNQIGGVVPMDAQHWRCLSDSMWVSVPAVQVMAWRMLTRLSAEVWAQDLLALLYLDEPSLSWAEAGVSDQEETTEVHRDANGAFLAAGDTVVLSKDLNVKGVSFTAKRGTAVRGISLVLDNPLQIEGRINGQQIVILTRFVKKVA